MKSFITQYAARIIASLAIAFILYFASLEFYQIAWGTGNWWGEFSRSWAALFFLFVLFSIALFAASALLLWKRDMFTALSSRLIAFRRRLGNFRWLFWLVVFIAPVWFFQFTAWGIVLQKFYIRILIWGIVVGLLTVLASEDDYLASWRALLSALILTSSAFSIMASLSLVNDYPFSQGWSEGNRLWDYSILFGRDRYLYPAEKQIPVLLEFGRQLMGGLPFLIPSVTIAQVRLWAALITILPYLLLGFATFRAGGEKNWIFPVLWAFLFLKQGPIQPPLVISAALVGLAWGAPLWLGIPLVFGAGYFAEVSRYTWVFAPGLWIFMLEIASASFPDRRLALAPLKRALFAGFFGILGGILPPVWSAAQGFFQRIASQATASAPSEGLTQFVVRVLTGQPLLWYRLLPNSTYGNGILLGLLFAVGPLAILLIYLTANRIWRVNGWQKTALALPLLAFLAVGLVASTKIGGGGDLHNTDMFLIGLFFTGAAAWVNGGREWLLDERAIPVLIKAVIILTLVNSSIEPLQAMRSYNFPQDVSWLRALTDSSETSDLNMLPPRQEVDTALQTIRQEVADASPRGEVLFMDQRQLLTFQYIRAPLVAEYDKKALINKAMSSDQAYFAQFYKDLAARRFSLIISPLLNVRIQDSSYQFGEENNAWVKWVSNPLLCFYQPKVTLKNVGVQLLVPNTGAVNCDAKLPDEVFQ